ncbi:hypothetical protein HD806DRAFT_527699 [Xylariaceae sp. AK1471]|nr:hypothetical protein HD806DRAFT_527699 [Xylariaceae sp. AK1471]
MSEPAFVVMPVRADGSPPQEHADEVAAAIERSLHENLRSREHQELNPKGGLLKKVVANPDSLYKYISWEDPVRTLGSYIGLLGLLFGLHYLHLTQLLLKMSAIGLGASDIVTRIRPEYKRVPEPTLNATLSDIHDLVQWLVLQAQKTMYGEDLKKSFGAFFGLTALFWLSKVMSLFGLAILGLSSLYIAPLIFSPRGREVAQDAKVRAQDLAHATAENAKVVAQDGRSKVADLSSMAQQTAGDLSSKIKKTTDNVSYKAPQTDGNLPSKIQYTAGKQSSEAQQIAENLSSTTH